MEGNGRREQGRVEEKKIRGETTRQLKWIQGLFRELGRPISSHVPYVPEIAIPGICMATLRGSNSGGQLIQ